MRRELCNFKQTIAESYLIQPQREVNGQKTK
jgi:hypothetical protein